MEDEAAEEPGTEEAVAAEAMIEVAAADVVFEEEATAEAAETLDAEVVAVDSLAAEETAAKISDDKDPTVEPTQAAPMDVPSAASAEPIEPLRHCIPLGKHLSFILVLLLSFATCFLTEYLPPASPVVPAVIYGPCKLAPSAVAAGLDGSDQACSGWGHRYLCA